MASTSTTSAAALILVAGIMVAVVASRERHSSYGLYDLSREPSVQKRFNTDFYNSFRRYKDRRVKRFPVGLYYSLMGEDLTNPQKRPDYDDIEVY